MKKLHWFCLICTALLLQSPASGQDSGTFWIKTFEPGSADLNDPQINLAILAKLDEMIKDETLDFTFLGAADSIGWRFNGKTVHPEVAEAWNDAKRLSRARVLQERYKRGTIGITYENVAGVKVVWVRKGADIFKNRLTGVELQNDDLNDELVAMRADIEGIQASMDDEVIIKDSRNFNWGLEVGVWGWRSGSGNNLFVPSIGLDILIDQTAFLIKGGITPWQMETDFGNQAKSFMYAGIKHFWSQNWGSSFGVFRGWEFYTATDEWSFKTTGIAVGVVYAAGIFEINPAINYSDSNTLSVESDKRIGFNLGLGLNLNKAF